MKNTGPPSNEAKKVMIILIRDCLCILLLPLGLFTMNPLLEPLLPIDEKTDLERYSLEVVRVVLIAVRATICVRLVHQI